MKINLAKFANEFNALREELPETTAVLRADRERRRRCVERRADGKPCRAWAMWDSPDQRCSSHTYKTRRRDNEMSDEIRREQNRRHAPTCDCPAYAWPHRASAGFCRFPDEPLRSWPTESGKRALGKLRRRKIKAIRRRFNV